MPTYKIPQENIPRLVEKISRLASKAEKLGGVITFNIESDEWVNTKDGAYRIYTVTVTGDAPKLNGWRFVAKLEHMDSGNVIKGQDVPEEYRTAGPNCDHCQLDRNRKDTYVVEKDGTFKQVGSSCLADFTGHPDPKAIADAYQYVWQAEELADEFSCDPFDMMGGNAGGVALKGYLTVVAWAIRKNGWLSKSKATEQMELSTSDYALEMMLDGKAETNDNDTEKATKALDWARSVLAAKEDKNQYENNLALICSEDFVELKHIGYAASVIMAYERWVEQQAQFKCTEFLGEVKKRQMWHGLYLVNVIAIDGFYGTTYLHKFQDESGNMLVWFSSSTALEEGKTYQGKATVKEHKVYRDQKQTVLTRCKFEEEGA